MAKLVHTEATDKRQVKVMLDEIDGTYAVDAFSLKGNRKSKLHSLSGYTTSDRKDAITAAKGLLKEHAK